ncbi:MAG: ABC transporter permease [Thermoleophilaceae bacterium]
MLEVLVASAVLLMTPLLLAALGEIVVERAGVLNIGIEGVMLLGAFCAAGAIQLDRGRGEGAVAALLVGALIGLVLAYLFIARRVNQIVGGVLFNLLALGLTTLLFVSSFDNSVTSRIYGEVAIPGLSALPFVGEALFSQPALVYASIGVVLLVNYMLLRTWFGLHLRAAGERPRALDTAGVSVSGVRTAAMAVGCALVGLGGGSIVLLESGAFTPNITEGRGFIALGIALVARWRPWWAVPAVALFGIAEAIHFQAGSLGLGGVPPELLAMLPYVVAIVAVTVGTAARYPAALGVPYARE